MARHVELSAPLTDMQPPQRIILIGICVLAFGLRLAAFGLLDRGHHPDIWESETIAVNLLEGRGFVYPFIGTTYRSYIEPLYPGLCAGVYALAGHRAWALGFVQALLGVGLVWLVSVCGRRIVSGHVAVFAALLAALHPGLIFYTTKFHPFVLDALLLAAVVAVALAVVPQHPWRSVLVVGGLLGLCVLTRPTILAFLPVLLWWVWTRLPGARRLRLARLAMLLITAALVVSPWVWRNYRVHNRFILTRSGTGLVFWLGNNPYRFTGSALTTAGEPLLFDALPASDWAHLLTLDELGQQDFLMAQAQRYIHDYPFAFLKRWAQKWGYFWWWSPQAGQQYSQRWFQVYQWFDLWFIGVALFGVWAHRRDPTVTPARRAGGWLLLGFCLTMSLTQSLFYVEGRHRLAIEPLLCILTAQGLWGLRSWEFSRQAAILQKTPRVL